MKFLFIVQGEGRGHLTQAITLEEILRRNGHEVVEVLVGKSSSRRLPGLEVTLHEPYSGDYIHGYMVNAGFSENVMKWHRQHPGIPLRFFWDKWEEEPVKRVDNTLSFYQLDDVEFLRQMAGCKAYASTAGFESVCEAMYLGKPILMVPAHIEQDCNAYDAEKSGAGIISSDFNLQQLLEFAKDYHPNRDFVYWVRGAEYTLLNLLESDSSNYQQVLFNEMYLVEEFI